MSETRDRQASDSPAAVFLGPRFVASPQFDGLYNDGMALVEEVAAYLDGPGRTESRLLSREISMVYATESMRLTTRLMQLASWLLLQRAVKEGEITAEQARSEKHAVNFRPVPPESRGPEWNELPEAMKELIRRGDAIYSRIAKLESMDRGEALTLGGEGNAVNAQLERLRAVFDSPRS